ncbi:hypothetical protein F4806DRAFT_475780 [Annulohypoxylon nitens]|nr:hypothetical protein F4806DRAFT_475780 [Annulohypoxylon nitens]
MSTDTLRLLLPRLLRPFGNYGRAKYLSGYKSLARLPLGYPPHLKLQTCTMSSMVQSPSKIAATDVSSMGKAKDSHAEPTTLVDDGEVEATGKKKVAILWDLDNKKPIALPEDLAITIRSLASKRGKIIEYSAMANYFANIRLPPAALELREQRKMLKAAEERGEYKPAELYRCPICGRKCATEAKLNKHYKQLHERELRKKKNKLNSLKGKKKRKWLEKKGANFRRRQEAHIEIVAPEAKHKVFRSLKRAGVSVRLVKKTPQAADAALMTRWKKVAKNSNLTLVLISDDSDFCEMVQRAKTTHGVHAIVVSERFEGKLAKVADEWWSWDGLNKDARDLNNISLREALAELSDSGEGESDNGPDYVVDSDVQEEVLELMLGNDEMENDEVEDEFENWR